MFYFFFLGGNWKNLLLCKMTNVEFFKKLVFMLKEKNLNLGPKMPYLGIFRLKLVKFEMSTLDFTKTECFTNVINFNIGSTF